MLLGGLMRDLSDETRALEALMSIGDLVLVAEIDELRTVTEETRGEYVAGAANRFANTAAREDWLSLMIALEQGSDPAVTCFKHMVSWSIAADRKTIGGGNTAGSCSCGGQCEDKAQS